MQTSLFTSFPELEVKTYSNLVACWYNNLIKIHLSKAKAMLSMLGARQVKSSQVNLCLMQVSGCAKW